VNGHKPLPAFGILIACLLFASPAFSAVTITISPKTVNVRLGSTQAFTATVTGTTNLAVTWNVNGVAGGNSSVRTINAGNYTAPAMSPGASVTVTAVSVADPTKSDSATVTLLNPVPVLTGVQPQYINTGLATTINVSGSNFVSGAQIFWGSTALTTTFISSTQLQASYTPADPPMSTVLVHIHNPAPGAADSGMQAVGILPPISVSISPTTANVRLFDGIYLAPTVTNAMDPTLTWSVNGVTGGNSTLGTISSQGVYLAPTALPSPNVVQVKAQSVTDPRASSTATITVQNPAPYVSDVQPRTINTGLLTTIHAYGARFAPGAQIYWGSLALPTTFVSSTELRASYSPTEAAGAIVSVHVRNPDPGAVDSAQTVAVTVVPPVSVSITPSSVSLRIFDAIYFPATVTNATDPTLTWSVNGIAGGNSTVGTVTSQGVYTVPAALPTPNVVQVQATSVQDPRGSSTATVTLQNPAPYFTDVQPRGVNTGLNTTLHVYGSRFAPGAQVYWGSVALPTTFVSSTELQTSYAPTEAANAQVALKVRNPDPGAIDSPQVQTVTVLAPIVVMIVPPTATLRLGGTMQFPSGIGNALDTTLNWSVNGIAGGNSTVGTISNQGVYTAPTVLPTPNVVQVKAASATDPTASSSSTVTLLNPMPVVTSVSPALTPATTSFTINGSGFMSTSTATLDGNPLSLTVVSSTQVTATATVGTPLGGFSVLKVTNPDPGSSVSQPLAIPVTNTGTALSYAATARFLEQASWGPTPDSIAHVMQIGRTAWITEQFNTPSSTYSDNIGTMPYLSSLQSQFMQNAVNGSDQLRQRVAFALGQVFVVSGMKLSTHAQMAPYQRLMLADAFGNFRTLMGDVTLSPSMGEYLDMVNSDKPYTGYNVLPNENYARELLQLFTIGPGNYTETDIKQLALILTGWTYPPSGATSAWTNPPYYTGPMTSFDTHHDMTAKTFLGTAFPAGRTAQQDLNAALDAIFNHPAMPQFVSYRLIQHLVTGNPSPAYVSRVAAVFANNGSNVRGDLQAVVRAILLDPEAATDGVSTLAADQGHLREPVLYLTTLLRNLGAGTLTPDNNMPAFAQWMGQNLFYPPSVFNYFLPSYPVPGFGIPGPEFQLLNTSTALTRANFAMIAVSGYLAPAAQMPLDHFDDLGWNVSTLLDAISNALYRGAMQPDMRSSITNALANVPDPGQRARTALFLAASHARYQSQR
jgi:hypothetical protein